MNDRPALTTRKSPCTAARPERRNAPGAAREAMHADRRRTPPVTDIGAPATDDIAATASVRRVLVFLGLHVLALGIALSAAFAIGADIRMPAVPAMPQLAGPQPAPGPASPATTAHDREDPGYAATRDLLRPTVPDPAPPWLR